MIALEVPPGLKHDPLCNDQDDPHTAPPASEVGIKIVIYLEGMTHIS